MVSSVTTHLRSQGVKLELADAAEGIVLQGDRLSIQLRSGKALTADFVVLSVGVRPENKLAVEAGLEVGQRGGIKVNEQMQTSDPDIYAVGDAVEVRSFVGGAPVQIPLGGPANRQGRLAADHIFGRSARYRGTQGTAVVGVFDMTAAMTGLSEKSLRAARTSRSRRSTSIPAITPATFLEPSRCRSNSCSLRQDGKILGAQVVGRNGVDKRIDVLAVAIQAGMTVYDLEEMELAYAPQYGSAKDPVNMAGFVAAGCTQRRPTDHPCQ